MGNGKVLWGLIGFPLSHSFSATWFNDKLAREGLIDIEYRLFPLASIEDFPSLLRSEPNLTGLNVTIPYKENIIPFLDELDEPAREIGAVNTICIRRENGKIRTRGFNTDAGGFLQSLPAPVAFKNALILGTGGAAKAVAFSLNLKNIDCLFVSRTRHGEDILNYQDLTPEIILNNPLIVQATPLGMYPRTDGFPPIPYHHLSENHFLYDLIYNPPVTEFMKRGKLNKAVAVNGLQMLINQAELSYGIFQNQAIS